jgi:RNA polymerase sigma-70 factor (ECF subfamily)
MLSTPPSLLDRLRQPSERDAWEKFVEIYSPLFYAWARRLCTNDHDAADLVQDLFTTLVAKLPQFNYDEQKSFRAWLKTILANRWRNHLRRRAVEGRLEAGVNIDALPGPPESPEFEEAEYRRRLVSRALALLQTEFQPITWKCFWEFVVAERPAAEVAVALSVTVNAVYLAKGRVLRRLREELRGLLD